jgi:hypothetical protein
MCYFVTNYFSDFDVLSAADEMCVSKEQTWSTQMAKAFLIIRLVSLSVEIANLRAASDLISPL